jgi:hypothetical protein
MEYIDISYYTSFIFLLNVCIGILVNNTIYTYLFLFLFITSILFRSFRDEDMLVADKVAIYAVILFGAYNFFLKQSSMSSLVFYLVIFTFFLTLFYIIMVTIHRNIVLMKIYK